MKWKTIEIDLESPNDVLNLYASRLHNTKDWETLSTDQLESVFVHIIHDYYQYGLSIDVLITIAESIIDKLQFQGKDEFINVLIPLADLDYSLRNVTTDEKTGSNIIRTLRDMYIYYEKNKYKIKTLDEKDSSK